MSTAPAQRRDRSAEFIEKLEKLDRGDLAHLRRNAGNTLAESRGVLGLFYRVLPPGVPERDHDRYFLVATLYPLADRAHGGNLGDSLRRARTRTNQAGFDRRVATLLDADADQLPFRLRQLVRLAHANRVGVDWQRLLHDVLQWSYADRRVQRAWAMAYFGEGERPAAPDADEPNAAATTDGGG